MPTSSGFQINEILTAANTNTAPVWDHTQHDLPVVTPDGN